MTGHRKQAPPSATENCLDSSVFRRPISPNEWIYLAGEKFAAPFAIQIVVEGTGSLDRDTVAKAVERSAAACPGARLVRRGKTWVDSGRAPHVRVTETWDAEPFQALDADGGRSCEVVLRPGDQPALLFRAHHAVMDGRGVLNWVVDTFRVLRGLEPVGAPSGMFDLALLDELGPRGRRPGLTPRFRSPLARGARGSSRGWLHRTVDGSHIAVVAKAAAALACTTGDPTRVMVPIDLRRYRPDLRSSANLSLPVFLDGRPGDSWEQWHERLLQALERNEELAGGRETAALKIPLKPLTAALGLVGRSARVLNRYPCSALITHLGRIEEEELQAPGFQATGVHSLPQEVPLLPLNLVATEFAGITRLTIARPIEPVAVRKAEQFLDSVAEGLLPATRRGPCISGRPSTHPPASLIEMLEQQVRLTPFATALTGPDGQLTYAEFDHRSDTLATVLRQQGAGAGSVVGLLSHRTMAAIIGLWAVLKVGAAYLPLDPNHPHGRTASLLVDTDAVLCLAGRDVRHGRPALPCPTLTLESVTDASGQTESTDSVRPYAPKPDDLAYVIYTSGSTGKPKGVMVEHNALTEYARWAIRHYSIDEGTRFAVFTSLAFDLTGTAHLLPLLTGGSIVLIPDEPDHSTLTAILEESSGVNSLKITPAHLELITRLEIQPKGFRLIVVGGEQLRGNLAARAQKMFGRDCRIINEYGPTEATIGCITHTFSSERDAARYAVPIGLPADNTAVYLLDPRGVPAPHGEQGEIHLATTQLARGYLQRPDLTRERFRVLADGTRTYRTGDLARRTPEGFLEFLGRNDGQLAIRGHRIEPQEIETALEAHPDVTQAVVLARPVRHGGAPALCAWVTGHGAPEAIRKHAGQILPAYLVPAVIQVLQSFPLTVNGKIDPAALPSPLTHRTTRSASTVATWDSPHAAVAEIWAEILEIDPLSLTPTSDFTQLGGDSIELLTMLHRVTQEVIPFERRGEFQGHIRKLVGQPTLHNIIRFAE